MKAIVYMSETGHTEAYAKILGRKTSLPVYELSEAKKHLQKGTDIIYMGWLFASNVKGYKKATKLYSVSSVIGIGLCPTGELIHEVRKTAGIPDCIPLFTLQGGMDHSKLKGINRFMIKMLVKMLTNKEKTAEENAMLELIKNGGYFVDANNTTAFMEWYINSKDSIK